MDWRPARGVPLPLPMCPWAKHLSKLSSTVKIRIADGKSGEGYRTRARHFQAEFSLVHNTIKRWQLKGTVEFKLSSRRPRNIQKEDMNQNPV